MAKRKSMQDDACPVARSLDLVGDRWSLLLVRDAFDGIRRFSDFQRNLGVARNILSDRLATLVEAGVLAVQPASDGTAYQEYVLTAKGESLFPVVVALRQWGERQLFAPGEPHSQLLTTATKQPLAPMLPSNAAGQVVQSHDTFVNKLPHDK
ncbi:UNVERIFIED_ORG: HxlR family transcriptional regulator [Zoogloea ramigera]|uniref:Helix-turn-helix domain-containing protein n=1 Tax=Duganella zoogloeoides TaxID=75659 RepID=A0ABZ0Y3S3_9BURK|nr:helix-turn-helix domain-containing protein [Duganella zoogloeoides]WQH06687.1 helix-turn-helix domain-containing protein [Duganella zoogloeoides]